ncbi:MAG TPA: protein kinase [Terracidiphilus sp.]|nr:protein kinase [Terracidiphilus sp.]
MNGQGRPAPERIGKYDIVGILGQGGMGVVYRARDPRIGRDVAIKTLTEGFTGDPDMLKRFYQEAGSTGNLRHPNIVTVYDFGDEEGLPYIVMEFLDGEPLDKLIREKDRLHLSTKLDIIEQVCAALGYAHLQGMIHRDVKPANVIVQRDGLVKLLDFGIARTGQQPGQKVDQGMTRTGTLVGTPAYMAPERLRGEQFDGRSDIFSTGVMLYQVLTGVLPFSAEYPAILHQILQEDPPPLTNYISGYPPLLDHVLTRALAKQPFDRYAHASDMATDLNAVGAQLKTQRAAELMAEAHTAIEAQDYVQAKQLLAQVVRMDSQNTEAKKLMAGVDQYFNQQKVRERVDQLKKAASDALAARNWDQVLSLCSEAQHLDLTNTAVADLLAKATAGKQTADRIQQLMREVETARHSGNYDTARDYAGQAAELDPSDTRIVAICKVLDQEATEARRKAQLRSLLNAAQQNLAAAKLAEASNALEQAEQIARTDPELLHLKDELDEALRQEERKRLVSALVDKAAVAIALEQLQEVMAELKAALEKMPTEATLLRLKIQLEPRLREHENKKLVADVSEACRRLPPVEALNRIREALAQLPGNADLLKLEAAITQRLTREQRQQQLAEYMAKARALLEDHLYLETVKVLELCEKDGFSSPEITELLNLARSAANERISQDLVERSFLEAKRLLETEDYDAVLKLLPPVLERVDEPALRRLLDEATDKQKVLEKRVEQVLAEVERLKSLELFDAAIGLIHSEPNGVRQSRRVQQMLDSCTAMQAAETARLEEIGAVYAALADPASAAAFGRIGKDTTVTPPAGTLDLQQRLGARVQSIATQQLTKSIESARQALSADDAVQAEAILQSASAWQVSASHQIQADFAALQTEIASSKKVLRFKKSAKR